MIARTESSLGECIPAGIVEVRSPFACEIAFIFPLEFSSRSEWSSLPEALGERWEMR